MSRYELVPGVYSPGSPHFSLAEAALATTDPAHGASYADGPGSDWLRVVHNDTLLKPLYLFSDPTLVSVTCVLTSPTGDDPLDRLSHAAQRLLKRGAHVLIGHVPENGTYHAGFPLVARVRGLGPSVDPEADVRLVVEGIRRGSDRKPRPGILGVALADLMHDFYEEDASGGSRR